MAEKKKNGRGERIRTSGPLLPKQMRYQAALRPEPKYRKNLTRRCHYFKMLQGMNL